MDKKTLIITIYTVLLLTPVTICREIVAKSKEKRQIALAPIASYTGLAVAPHIFLALVAAYGIYAVVKTYRIKSNTDNHSCANNRGWCRSSCQSHEYIDNYHSDVCGSYKCCRPGNG